MGRDHPSHCSNRLSCAALLKEQEHGATAHIEGAITLIGVHAWKTEKRFIETRAFLDVFYVNAGFEDAHHLRHQDSRAVIKPGLTRILNGYLLTRLVLSIGVGRSVARYAKGVDLPPERRAGSGSLFLPHTKTAQECVCVAAEPCAVRH